MYQKWCCWENTSPASNQHRPCSPQHPPTTEPLTPKSPDAWDPWSDSWGSSWYPKINGFHWGEKTRLIGVITCSYNWFLAHLVDIFEVVDWYDFRVGLVSGRDLVGLCWPFNLIYMFSGVPSEKIYHPTRKGSSSNHQFWGAMFKNADTFGGVVIYSKYPNKPTLRMIGFVHEKTGWIFLFCISRQVCQTERPKCLIRTGDLKGAKWASAIYQMQRAPQSPCPTTSL